MKGSVVIAFAIAWAGYTVAFTGYSWLKGYNLSFKQIVAPVNFYQGQWPPACYKGPGVFPSGDSSDDGPCGGGGTKPQPPGTTTYTSQTKAKGQPPAGLGAVGGGYGR